MSYVDESSATGPRGSFGALRQVPTGAVRLAGYHNHNFVVHAPVGLYERRGRGGDARAAKYRFPIPGARKFDWFPWGGEEELLNCLNSLENWRGRVPRVLERPAGYSVHSFAEGVSLGSLRSPGEPVRRSHLAQITGLFALMAEIPGDLLPRCPDGWPDDGDSHAFFRRHVQFARDVFEESVPDYFPLFSRLGVRKEALDAFADTVPRLSRRPFVLLHGDLHRENMVVRPSGELFFIDWELAMRGDPVYDLATHLRLMRYPREQEAEVIRGWYEALARLEPSGSLVAGMSPGGGPDLRTYLAFKRLQAVHTDTVRSAVLLDRGGTSVRDAALTVCRVLREAREPLRLETCPTPGRVEAHLRDWLLTEGRGPALP